MRPNSITTLAVNLTLCAVAAAQTTWHVDIHATGPGNGTPSQPFPTIGAALANSSLEDGDTVLVAPGVYPEAISVERELVVCSSGGPLVTALRPPQGMFSSPTLVLDSLGATAEVRGFTLYARPALTPYAYAVDLDGFGATLRECIVIGTGVATGIDACTATIQDCVVTGFGTGIGIPTAKCTVYVRDSIVWNNVRDLYGVNAYYTCFGTSNDAVLSNCVQSSPLWVNGTGNDFHLTPGSPCIDAGNPSTALDPDGSRADMGPLAFDASYASFTVYCTAKTNSLGCVPSVSASGNASFAANVPFNITCVNELNQKLGLLFYGFAPKNTAYQGGYLCVQSPVHRTALINSGGNAGPDDCSGGYSFDFNARIQSHVDPMLELGAEVFAQFWSRDPNASFTTNRSDAVRFRIQP